MNILLLRGFNNYFNRIVKKYSTIADYKNNSSSFLDLANINFNPNDGVATELVIGSVNQLESNKPLAWDQVGTPDYLVCYENEGDPAVAVIKFRWFILESERTRDGQYRIALKRDVIAEHFDEVMNSPCYVEKGYINDTANPLLYNPEGLQLNQIKQNETLLKDETNCAWLVGYVKKDASVTEYSATRSSDTSQYDSLASLPFNTSCINIYNKDGTSTLATKTIVDNSFNYPRTYFTVYQSYWALDWGWFYLSVNPYALTLNAYKYVNGSGYCAGKNANFMGTTSAAMTCSHNYDDWSQQTNNNLYANNMNSVLSDVSDTNWATIRTNFINYIFNKSLTGNKLIKKDNVDVLSYNGKIVKDTNNNKLYKLSIALSDSDTEFVSTSNYANDATVQTFFQNFAGKMGGSSINTGDSANPKIDFRFSAKTYSITATEVDAPTSLKIKLPGTGVSRNATNDALYDMFCIPYNKDAETLIATAGSVFPTTTFAQDSDDALFVAQQLMTKLGTTNVGDSDGGKAYDLQLLPYCPLNVPVFKNLLTGKTVLKAYDLDTASYTIIKNASDADKVIIFYPTEANFTKTISKTIKFVGHDTFEENFGPSTVSFSAVTPPTPFPGYIRGQIVKPAAWTTPFSILSSTLKINGVEVADKYIRATSTAPNITIYINSNDYSAGDYTVELSMNIRTNRDYTPLELKVANEGEFMRLTSPNFNGMFEFKLSKFNDGIHSINIDCSYKPYSPYIKLNPDFSGLYGSDFNDSTGLILAGDFSLSTLSDPWINYQLNNKNYQQVFNRQIENLDVNNQIAQEQLQFNNTVGLLTGTTGGAVGGAMTGAKAGPYGAIAGAAVGGLGGGLLAAAGAQMNQDWLNRQQAEAKSYAIDMYNYQLGNIKALPATITKSDPLTYNNKIWPILEEFSCTEVEKELVSNKIRYNSMNIMAIGRLAEYSLSNELDKVYVKGQLIRNDEIADDFHIIDAIYQEVNKGFYVPQE